MPNGTNFTMFKCFYSEFIKIGLKMGLIFSLLGFAACTKKTEEAKTQTPAPANKVINLAIWGNYLSPETQKKFTETTGYTLNISNYSSNEELLAKVQSGSSGYDVAVPSDYMVDIMAKSNLLEVLDKSKVSNLTGVKADFLKQAFDPENKYSVPYTWSTAGFAINRDLYKGELKTWKDIMTKEDLKGKLSLLDDVREVMAAALKANGYSVNTLKKDELDKAKKTLMSVRSRVKMFRSDTIDLLVNKEVAVAQAYSSDALQAVAQSGGKIEYILPEDGGTRAIDNLVIVKGAKNPEGAHALINFLLSKEANIEFVKTIMGGPVVAATQEALPTELKQNKALFPAPEVLNKFERLEDLGDDTKVYDRIWTELKVQ